MGVCPSIFTSNSAAFHRCLICRSSAIRGKPVRCPASEENTGSSVRGTMPAHPRAEGDGLASLIRARHLASRMGYSGPANEIRLADLGSTSVGDILLIHCTRLDRDSYSPEGRR